MMDTPPPPSLRDGLIDAAMALLDEGGMAALTLRRAAARAGVSHAAPAHHFDGLPGLLTAVAARAFAIFADTMQAAATSDDPTRHLLGICQGYLGFARRHHGLFHVMFVSPEVDRAHPDLVPQSRRAYLMLRTACLPFAPPGAEADVALETAVWSMVHGYASLGFINEAARTRPLTQVPDFAVLVHQLLAGRQVTPRNPLAPPVNLR